MKESHSQEIFSKYMLSIFTFLQNVCQEKNFQIYKEVAGLLGDLVDCQGTVVAPLLQQHQQWISQVITCL